MVCRVSEQYDRRDRERDGRHGFVVSERLGARSFGDLFYAIYSRDLPVFISTDAVLHAWHRTYDAMLKDLEVNALIPALDRILSGMAEALPKAEAEYPECLRPSAGDADLFLAVGRSLLAGSRVPATLADIPRLDRVLAKVSAMGEDAIELFGRPRLEDFSQYKPRGHYTDTPALGQYFRAMMWCGRTDLRVAGDSTVSSPRQLGAALILRDLLLRSGGLEEWHRVAALIEGFFGRSDSMTFDQLGDLLDAGGLHFPQDFRDPGGLTSLQERIVAAGAGRQAVRSHLYISPAHGPVQAELPASFTVIGQRFTLDNWAASKIVADDIFWDNDKVQRRIPSALDLAFAVLQNSHAVPTLVRRMTASEGLSFRDHLNYQHNLAAVLEVIDRRPRDTWDESLYSLWLSCPRELSAPTTDPRFPDIMRTSAWADKTLNTQLASWTELRHDTVLYAKQSVTIVATCDYPAGYVEPRPEFWRRFQRMAEWGADLMERTSLPETPSASSRNAADRAAFLRNFAHQLSILAWISDKELAGLDLSAEETLFLKDVVEVHRSSGPPGYRGWYPGLFYDGGPDCAKYDALVADVHTDPPAGVPMWSGFKEEEDPGCILEEATGGVELFLGAFNCGGNRTVYAGPVLSHYEWQTAIDVRLTDEDWRGILANGGRPAQPDWTVSYLVPAPPSP